MRLLQPRYFQLHVMLRLRKCLRAVGLFSWFMLVMSYDMCCKWHNVLDHQIASYLCYFLWVARWIGTEIWWCRRYVNFQSIEDYSVTYFIYIRKGVLKCMKFATIKTSRSIIIPLKWICRKYLYLTLSSCKTCMFYIKGQAVITLGKLSWYHFLYRTQTYHCLVGSRLASQVEDDTDTGRASPSSNRRWNEQRRGWKTHCTSSREKAWGCGTALAHKTTRRASGTGAEHGMEPTSSVPISWTAVV
jgi:hypothetical protein